MEDGLVWCSSCDESKRMVVLILIVVEDGLVLLSQLCQGCSELKS